MNRKANKKGIMEKEGQLFFYASEIKGKLKYVSNMDEFHLKALVEYINERMWQLKNEQKDKTVGGCI